MCTGVKNEVQTYERPEVRVILLSNTIFILYDLPPVEDGGEDEW